MHDTVLEHKVKQLTFHRLFEPFLQQAKPDGLSIWYGDSVLCSWDNFSVMHQVFLVWHNPLRLRLE